MAKKRAQEIKQARKHKLNLQIKKQGKRQGIPLYKKFTRKADTLKPSFASPSHYLPLNPFISLLLSSPERVGGREGGESA